MSIADSYFHRAEGDDLHRSRNGLAYSDREIALMKSWVNDCEEKARRLIASLAECITVATKALEPISGRSIEDALFEYDNRIRNLKGAISRIERPDTFKKEPFHERHFIPSGGMPSGIEPRDFDEHRNDESVYDKAFAKALKAHKEKALEEKTRKEIAAREAEEKREAMQEQLHRQRVIDEFLGELPKKSRSSFEAKLEDLDFRKAFSTAVDSTGALVAAVAIDDGKRIDEYRKKLTAQITERPDLLAVARVYLEAAEAPISMMQAQPHFGIPASRIPQGVAVCKKILREIESIVEKLGMKSKPSSTAKPSKAKSPAQAANPPKSTSKRS